MVKAIKNVAPQAPKHTIKAWLEKSKDKKRNKQERKKHEYIDILNASADVVEAECKMIDRHRQKGLAPMQYWMKMGLHGPYVTLNHGRYRVFNNTATLFHRYKKHFKTNEEARDYSQAVLQLFNLYTVTRGDTFQLSWKAPNGKK